MKNLKLSLSILVVLFSITASFGQIPQGTWSIGGNLIFNSSTVEIDGISGKAKESLTQFTPGVAYYVIDNLALGVNFGIGSSVVDLGNGDKETTSLSFIGVEGVYKVSLSESMYVPIGIGDGLNTQKYDDPLSGTLKFTGLGVGLGTGLEYIVNTKLGVALLLDYTFGTLSEVDLDVDLDITQFTTGLKFTYYITK